MKHLFPAISKSQIANSYGVSLRTFNLWVELVLSHSKDRNEIPPFDMTDYKRVRVFPPTWHAYLVDVLGEHSSCEHYPFIVYRVPDLMQS